MKISKLGLLFLAAILLLSPFSARTAKADPAVSFDFFYSSLEPYGEWVDMPEYGLCWHPSNVEEDWAPYMDGYWANTDAGWTWVSYEDWGGITYHYGRWAKVPDEGWFWVPDYEWAPAWVSWRSSDDYVGWAPLPPTARWHASVGFSFWVDSYCDIGPTYYNFCPVRYFGNPALRPVIIDRRQNITIINQTTNITNITVNKTNNIIYNGGPSYTVLARKSIKPIQTLKLRQQTDLADFRQAHGPIMAHQRGNELVVVAPRVEAPGSKFKPAHAARVLPPKPIDTGWAGISDPKLKNELHSKIKAEAKNVTPEKAPAMPPAPREIQAFEQRIKSQPSQPAAATVQQLPGQNQPGAGKHGKHDKLTPFMTPVPQKPVQAAQPTPSTVEQGNASTQGGGFPPAGVSKRDQQKQALEERKQQAKEEQLQRKQQASQEQALRAQQEQQKAQEKAMRKEQEKQAAQAQQAQREQAMQQERLRDQQQRSQEQQLRAQEAQQRRAEQQQRVQELNSRRESERESKHQMQQQIQQPRVVPQQIQPQAQTPSPSKGEGKHGKEKGDKDSDR